MLDAALGEQTEKGKTTVQQQLGETSEMCETSSPAGTKVSAEEG